MADATPHLKRPSMNGPRQNAPLGYLSPEDRKILEHDRRMERIRDHGDDMKSFMVELSAFRKTWGVFTVNGSEFDYARINGPYISEFKETQLRGFMRETLTRATDRLAKAKSTSYLPIDGDNNLPDADVAAGVRALSIDGWSAYDKSLGDGCSAMLDIDYAGAIKLARTIIGKYRKTLREAGVIA